MKEREAEKGEDMEGPDFDGQEEVDKVEGDQDNNLSNEDTNSNSGAEAKKEEGSPSKKKEKSLIVNQAGFATLYKTPIKDN